MRRPNVRPMNRFAGRAGKTILTVLLPVLLVTGGCDVPEPREPAEKAVTQPAAPREKADAGQETSGEVSPTLPADPGENPMPPSPPVLEDFDGEPQLSLFPRAGDFQPEAENREGQQYWRTFIEHLLRICGPAAGRGPDGSRAWALKGLRGIDSVGFFSPLAVEPETTYRVTFDFLGELPDGDSAGVGAIEFDEFLWVGVQFPESLAREHQTGLVEGVRLTGSQGWLPHDFVFRTSPETRMIHLVLFRDGGEGREAVFFDNLQVAPVEALPMPSKESEKENRS